VGLCAYIKDRFGEFGKLSPKGKKCIFIRYSERSKGYVFIDELEDGSITEIVSRDVRFLENDFPKKGEIGEVEPLYEMLNSEDQVMLSNILDNSMDQEMIPGPSGSYESQNPIEESELQIRKSTRKGVPKRSYEIEDYVFLVSPTELDEPNSVTEALSSSKRDEWLKAMKEELESMKTNKVWDLVDLPKERKAIGNKWILKVKRKSDGSIERHKARLVAKGFTQEVGIDYEETFSPVVKFTSIRLLLAIVARLDLELHQMDVKTAFLNGELNEEIYIEQPVGFVVKGQEKKVCKLKRSIYGLKQSSRQWYLRFHKEVMSFDFTMIDEDHCIYVKKSNGNFVILSLYIDDILLVGYNLEYVKTVKSWLSKLFDMKDMGETDYILGVKIQRDRSKKFLSLSQETYIKKILERFRMNSCKSMDTPVARGETLSLEICQKTEKEKEDMFRVSYSRVVGSLMYAMMCTHLDICYDVSLVSRYQSNPRRDHWKTLKRTFRYLKGTSDHSLCYSGSDLFIKGLGW